MSDALDYFRAHAVKPPCKAAAMPFGRLKRLQRLVGSVYHLLTKEAAYGPTCLQHMEDFRGPQKLESRFIWGLFVNNVG
jgi:hypothetical protein